METVAELDRITQNPEVMGGKPCIRGMRVTAGMLVGLIASGLSHEAILAAYPYLEEEDIRQALAYSAWRTDAFNFVCGISKRYATKRDGSPRTPFGL